jgi:hypothetical protein
MGKIPDDLVLEAASRFADAQAGTQPGDGWQRLTEEQQQQLAAAVRALLVWLDARPKPH